MKVTFQTCCGVDVHKSFLVATIIKTSSGIEPSYQKRRFSTFNMVLCQDLVQVKMRNFSPF